MTYSGVSVCVLTGQRDAGWAATNAYDVATWELPDEFDGSGQPVGCVSTAANGRTPQRESWRKG